MMLTEILKRRFATFMRMNGKVFRWNGGKPCLKTITKAGNKSIAVKLESDLLITSGIAMFTITPSREITGRDSLIVSIRRTDVQPARFDKLTSNAFPIGVHTHFLPSGTHNVDFSVVEDDREVFKGTILISVAHESTLAKSVETIFKQNKVPLAFRGTCDASHYPYDAEDSRPWFDRDDADAHIEELLQSRKIDSQEAAMLRNFVRDGFLVAEGRIDDQLINEVNTEIDDAISKGYQGYRKGSSARMEHLHQHYPNIRKLWLDKRHLRLANLVFNGRARPCQTLVFVCGSQQDVRKRRLTAVIDA